MRTNHPKVTDASFMALLPVDCPASLADLPLQFFARLKLRELGLEAENIGTMVFLVHWLQGQARYCENSRTISFRAPTHPFWCDFPSIPQFLCGGTSGRPSFYRCFRRNEDPFPFIDKLCDLALAIAKAPSLIRITGKYGQFSAGVIPHPIPLTFRRSATSSTVRSGSAECVCSVICANAMPMLPPTMLCAPGRAPRVCYSSVDSVFRSN